MRRRARACDRAAARGSALGGWLVAVVVILSIGAVISSASAAAFTIRDQTGRSITLPAPPRRIVSLVPSVTEILFAIGAQDLLVGVTDFCDYPPDARKKRSVGGMLAPSLETIVTLKPDLVIATTSGNREETFAQLGRLSLPVYVVDPVRLGDVLDLIARLGALTGHEAEAARLSASLGARIDEVKRRVAGFPRPRVLYVLWPDPLIVPARGALVSELLVIAGADSVTAEGGDGYPRYGLEAAIAGSPEVIILASHGGNQGPMARDKWARFTGLPAVKAGRVHSVSGDILHRYGPRVVDGLEQLARLIHPEAFRKAAVR